MFQKEESPKNTKYFCKTRQKISKTAKGVCYHGQMRGDIMIEIISRENESQDKGQEIVLPKNIRQIGSPKGRHKIYMEDYVYTYLKTQAKENSKCAAVLVGKSCISKDIRYTFISGAVECGQAVFQWDSIYLDESFWEYIYMEEKENFPDTVIVGWFVGEHGGQVKLSSTIESAHRKYFAGRDKVLMLMDSIEEEEVLYIYEQGYLQKREGYYIYYEKNIAMQEYMVAKKEHQRIVEPEPPEEEEPLWRCPASDKNADENIDKNLDESTEEAEEVSEWEILHKEMQEQPVTEKIFVKSGLEEPDSKAETALKNYRKMILEKRGQQVERHNKRFLYTASSFFMILLCIIGISTINNYHKMKDVEDVLYVMKDSVEESIKSEKKEESQSGVTVESIASEVKPLDENKGNEETKNQENKSDKKKDQAQSNKRSNEEPQKPEEEAKPAEDAQATETTPEEPKYYTVQAGDTLQSICLKIYQDKSMISKLCEANEIENGDRIQAGQKLILP